MSQSMKHWILVSQQTLPSEIFTYMGYLFLLQTLKQKQTHPLSLYNKSIQPKHCHNLKGKFNKRFECLKSQF